MNALVGWVITHEVWLLPAVVVLLFVAWAVRQERRR